MNIYPYADFPFEKIMVPNTAARFLSKVVEGRPRLGGRNSHLISIGGALRRKGWTEDAIASALAAANATLEHPLNESEVLAIAKSAGGYDAPIDMSEKALADQFAKKCYHELRYSNLGWLSYDGTRWIRDPQGMNAQEQSKAFVAEVAARVEAAELPPADRSRLLKRSKQLQRKSIISNIAELAKSDPLVLDNCDWTNSALTVNFLNGTLKLPSLELCPHDPADRLLKVLPYNYDPTATAPNFDNALEDLLPKDVADYLMTLFGYALKGTGELQEGLFIVGAGRNGKTTVIEGIANAFGEYATAANPTTFMKTRNKSSINNDIAALKGARLAVTTELNPGEVLDGGILKKLTGGDTINARLLYQEATNFRFAGLFILVSNFVPNFDGSDFALARRMNVVMFDRTIDASDVDRNLPQKLKFEAPGIMNRILSGYKRYEAGYIVPNAVRTSTERSLRDANQVLQFVEDCCNIDAEGRMPAGAAYTTYRVWASQSGLTAMSMPYFKGALQRTLNIEQKRSKSTLYWPGVALKSI